MVAFSGFSVLMFIFTMWIMLQNRKRRNLNKGMLGAACMLLVLSTAVSPCVTKYALLGLTDG